MSWLSNGLKKVERAVGSVIPHTSAAEKRAAMQATTAQIGYYTEAKNQLISQNAETETQKSVERAKINEKGIRAKRNASRSKSSSISTPVDNEVKSTLG